MLIKSTITLACMACLTAVGQISQGGTPSDWSTNKNVDLGTTLILPDLPEEKVMDIANAKAESGQQFSWGIPRPLHLDLIGQGDQMVSTNGEQLIRKTIRSSGAAMISIQFGQFDLIPGAELYLYDRKKTRYIGALTEANELPTGGLATAVLPGDEIVLEYHIPKGVKGTSSVVIESIVHGVKDMFKLGTQLATSTNRDLQFPFSAAPCNNNVECAIASGWEDEIRSVALFLRPDGNGCSGILLNNTAEDGRPLFHVANHCFTADVGSWVFYWNYQAPACVGDTGISSQTTSGATLIANDFFDDFALLELFNAPPASYDVYYAGWDATGTQPTSEVVIHHPAYDVKKITFDNDPASSYVGGNGTQLWGCTWESGVVQFGSSGGPLYDQNHRMIGHMYEGSNECATVANEVTGCAKLSASWDGIAASTRLKDHLDPVNGGTTLVMDGFDPANVQTPPITLLINVFLQGPYDNSTGLMKDDLRVAGLIPSIEPYSGLGYQFQGGNGGNEQISSAFLAQSGNQAVLDWILVELRSKNDIANIIASKAAILCRNSTIVGADGNLLTFTVPADDYFVAVIHRNHLGIVTAAPHSLNPSGITMMNLSDGSVPLNGGIANAQVLENNTYLMYAGDVNGDQILKYAGAGNDRDLVLLQIGGSVPTNVLSSYERADINLDGQIKYTGASNDRDPILLNVGGSIPTNTKSAELP